jgi:hypothetical protein
MVQQLIEINEKIENIHEHAEKGKMPTSITMGLCWLREDIVKVLFDIETAFPQGRK